MRDIHAGVHRTNFSNLIRCSTFPREYEYIRLKSLKTSTRLLALPVYALGGCASIDCIRDKHLLRTHGDFCFFLYSRGPTS